MEYFGKDLFANKLISWYQDNQRDLPWRHTRDPYKIWLSEVILQQTRVSQGLPYYQSFVAHFPEVFDLVNATEQQVLRLWQGLGYYSRGRNLLKCARMVVEELDGKFPNNYMQLLELPGIGEYTAAAIASIAFKEAVPVVDGNVFRVVSRVLGISDDIAVASSRKVFFNYSKQLMMDAPPDLYNQAVMEFGALHCTPKQPKCDSCPLSLTCYAFQNSRQHQFPVKSKKVKVRNRDFYYLVIKSGASYLLNKRASGDIWQGLYDFYLIEGDRKIDPIQLIEDHLSPLAGKESLEVGEPTPIYNHKLSHQHIRARFIVVEPRSVQVFDNIKKQLEMAEFEAEELHDLPKPILIDNYLKADIF